MRFAARHTIAIAAILTLGAQATAQGVELRRDAAVYFGSASNTTAPASIDEDQVREATPEYRKIESEGIRKGTARYKILMAEMDKRIRAAVRTTVSETKNDLVVRDGDVLDARGKEVADITDDVIDHLEDIGPSHRGMVPGGGSALASSVSTS